MKKKKTLPLFLFVVKNYIKISIFALWLLICTPLMKAQSIVINRSEDVISKANVLQSEAKKSWVINCLYLAAEGTYSVAKNHAKDAARVIYDAPESEDEIVYQPDDHAPDDYVEFFQKELFSKRWWKQIESGESGLRQLYHDQVYESFKENQRRTKPNISSTEEKLLESYLSDFAYKMVDRFYLPNFKAVFVNNMYCRHDFKNGKLIEIKEYIKKEDLPLVIEVLEERNRANKRTMSSIITTSNTIDEQTAETVLGVLISVCYELQNVIVDHYNEAIRTISATPNDTAAVIFQPDDFAPESYIEMIEERVFQSKTWITIEDKIMAKGSKDYYDIIMKSYDNIGLISITGSLPTEEQWMSRFILPNFRALFVKHLYWDLEGKFKESNLSKVILFLDYIINKQ